MADAQDDRRFDACMKLADYAAGRHDARRQYEWKVSFGYWVILLTAILEFPRNICPANAILLISVVLYAAVWLRNLWIANEKDKEMSFYYRDMAKKVLGGHVTEVPPSQEDYRKGFSVFGFLGDWAMVSHLGISVLLVALFFATPVIGPTK